MHTLVNWIAQLVQILYCILCSIVDQAECNSRHTFSYILVDLFVHSSGPFGGLFFVWGVLQNPDFPPPPLATALGIVHVLYM